METQRNPCFRRDPGRRSRWGSWIKHVGDVAERDLAGVDGVEFEIRCFGEDSAEGVIHGVLRRLTVGARTCRAFAHRTDRADWMAG